MKLAFRKVKITPELPDRLSGFGSIREAHEVLDDLYARVFLFEDLLWVQLDLVGIGDEVLEKVKAYTGLDKVILSCTHTHSGVDGTLNTKDGPLKGLDIIFGLYNPDYIEKIALLIKETVLALKEELKPAQLRLFKTPLTGLGTDRHNADLKADDTALGLLFKVDNKRALILKAACHPTVLNGSNLKVSADFCGAIEKEFNDLEMVAYVNGSAGDMSTRFTRLKADESELKRYGKLVFEQIEPLLEGDFSDFTLDYAERVFDVAVRDIDPIDVAEKKVKDCLERFENAKKEGADAKTLRLIESFLEGAQNNLLCSHTLKGVEYLPLNVEYLKINDQVLIFTPVELFSKLSNLVKQEYPYEFISYTNGYLLYMADREAYDLNHYEACSSPFKKGSGEQLMEAIKTWVLQLN